MSENYNTFSLSEPFFTWEEQRYQVFPYLESDAYIPEQFRKLMVCLLYQSDSKDEYLITKLLQPTSTCITTEDRGKIWSLLQSLKPDTKRVKQRDIDILNDINLSNLTRDELSSATLSHFLRTDVSNEVFKVIRENCSNSAYLDYDKRREFPIRVVCSKDDYASLKSHRETQFKAIYLNCRWVVTK